MDRKPRCNVVLSSLAVPVHKSRTERDDLNLQVPPAM